jgi:hypothetical protein
MKRSVVSALLVLVAVAISVSVVYGAPREEISLTTIIPDQQVLRAKKGIVSSINYKPSVLADASIDPGNLYVESKVGIGTTNPSRALHVSGTSGMRLQPSPLPSSASAGDIVIDSNDSNKFKYYNGTSWVPLGGGGTTYVSEWKALSRAGSNVTFSHPLDTDNIMVEVQFKPTLTGIIRGQHTSDYGGEGYGVEIYEISSTQIKVCGGSAGIRFLGSDGKYEPFSDGYVRVLARTVD